MYISQRSAATQLRCGGIFRKHFTKFSTECAGGKIWKIGQYFATNKQYHGHKCEAYFWGHPVYIQLVI